MTYQCGIGAGIPGLPAREPHFLCDGCGAKRFVVAGRLGPPLWFVGGWPPPRWKRLPDQRTLCAECKPTPEEPSR